MRFKVILLLAAVSLGFGTPRASYAMDKNVHIVLDAGAYGLAGGTVLGLASMPFSQNTRTIFIGSSVGLYLGLAVGIYYVWDKLYGHPDAYRSRLYEGELGPTRRREWPQGDSLASAKSGAFEGERRVQVPLVKLKFD